MLEILEEVTDLEHRVRRRKEWSFSLKTRSRVEDGLKEIKTGGRETSSNKQGIKDK